MKVCKIVDESRDSLLIGYLFSFDRGAYFSVELSEDLTAEEAPLFFESLIRKGQLTVDPVWSERWVRSRIVPEDRQNLGVILRDNKLTEYDEYRLLMLGCGRCAQDDCAVIRVDAAELPEWLQLRRQRKLEYAVPIGDREILSLFRDGTIRRTDPVSEGIADERLERIFARTDLIQQMRMIPGGLGVLWQEDIVLTAEQLYGSGEQLPINNDELNRLIRYYVMLTSDVCSELNCSRQYVDKKVKDGTLKTFKGSGSARLYTAGEIIRLVE